MPNKLSCLHCTRSEEPIHSILLAAKCLVARSKEVMLPPSGSLLGNWNTPACLLAVPVPPMAARHAGGQGGTWLGAGSVVSEQFPMGLPAEQRMRSSAVRSAGVAFGQFDSAAPAVLSAATQCLIVGIAGRNRNVPLLHYSVLPPAAYVPVLQCSSGVCCPARVIRARVRFRELRPLWVGLVFVSFRVRDLPLRLVFLAMSMHQSKTISEVQKYNKRKPFGLFCIQSQSTH